METPSSTRRVTRSQTLADLNNSNNIPISKRTEESAKSASKSRQRTGKQQALIDITNDSPIVGLATGSLETPSSMAKLRLTPGSGEALLRGQVKALLQKVEEEAELSKLSLESRQFLPKIQGLANSPIGILAPTPANTPHILNLSTDSNSNGNFPVQIDVKPTPVQEQLVKISEVVVSEIPEVKKNDSWITRSLLLDFSDKPDSSDSSDCSSVVTEVVDKSSSLADDDDASVWSIQVNASTKDDDDIEEIGEEDAEEEEENYEEEKEEEEDYGDEGYEGGLVDELCEGMNKMNVNEKRMMPKFMGIHKRFVYNNDDELVGEEIVVNEEEHSKETEESVLHLKGLPTPKGKHLRFQEDDDEEEEED